MNDPQNAPLFYRHKINEFIDIEGVTYAVYIDQDGVEYVEEMEEQ